MRDHDVVERTPLPIPRPFPKRLRVAATERRVSMAEPVREAPEEKLARHRPKPRSLGFVDAAVLAVTERFAEPKLVTLDRRPFAKLRPRHVDALWLLPLDDSGRNLEAPCSTGS